MTDPADSASSTAPSAAGAAAPPQWARAPWRRLAAACALGLVALTACSSEADEESGATASSGAATTVDFSYRDISVTVPADPKRVVVIEGRGDLEFALIAGYPVVGTRSGGSEPGTLPGLQFDGLLDADTTVLSSGDVAPNYEEIAALDPDLIVMRVNAWDADWYGNERLGEIAPVLPVEANRAAIRSETQAQLDLLGRSGAAQTWVTAYDDAIAAAKKRIGDSMQGKKIAMLTTQSASKGNVLVWTNLIGTEVAHDLGLDVMFRDEADEEGFFEISTEELDRLADADAIFFQTEDPAATEALPTWQALPAVKAGRTFVSPLAYNNGLLITGAAIAGFLADSLTGTAAGPAADAS